MNEITVKTVSDLIRGMLNEDWEIHVDKRESYQIPSKPAIRRGRTVTTYSTHCWTSTPVHIGVFLYAASLSELRKRILDGDLWEEIRKEFEKKAVTLSPDDLAKLGITPRALPARPQLSLTFRSIL